MFTLLCGVTQIVNFENSQKVLQSTLGVFLLTVKEILVTHFDFILFGDGKNSSLNRIKILCVFSMVRDDRFIISWTLNPRCVEKKCAGKSKEPQIHRKHAGPKIELARARSAGKRYFRKRKHSRPATHRRRVFIRSCDPPSRCRTCRRVCGF